MQFLRGSLTLELTHPLIHNMSLLSLCENRSLGIHVADMDVEEPSLLEKIGFEVEEENGEEEQKLENEAYSKVPRRQLMLIYSLHLAEAYAPPSTFSASLPSDFLCRIVASSLQPQLYMLLRDSQLCGSINSAYWTGLVETVFALGSIAGESDHNCLGGFFSRGNSLRDRKAFTGAALGTSMVGGRLHS